MKTTICLLSLLILAGCKYNGTVTDHEINRATSLCAPHGGLASLSTDNDLGDVPIILSANCKEGITIQENVRK